MKNLFTLLLVFFTVQSFAQTVENIRVEQDGENLKIHYRIGGSTAQELYFVTLTCSIDGAAPFEPKSVIGDVGANIRGGKSFNTIVWDVFEDVEEIGSVEFFVKVDLTSVDGAPVPSLSQPQVASENKEVTTNVSKKGQYTIRTRFIGLDGSTFSPLGLRMGSLMNWGYQFSIRYGYDGYFSYASLTAGFTKRVFETRKFRMHGYVGVGLGDFFDSFEFEFGAIGVLSNRVNLNMGYASNIWYSNPTLGIGLVF